MNCSICKKPRYNGDKAAKGYFCSCSENIRVSEPQIPYYQRHSRVYRKIGEAQDFEKKDTFSHKNAHSFQNVKRFPCAPRASMPFESTNFGVQGGAVTAGGGATSAGDHLSFSHSGFGNEPMGQWSRYLEQSRPTTEIFEIIAREVEEDARKVFKISSTATSQASITGEVTEDRKAEYIKNAFADRGFRPSDHMDFWRNIKGLYDAGSPNNDCEGYGDCDKQSFYYVKELYKRLIDAGFDKKTFSLIVYKFRTLHYEPAVTFYPVSGDSITLYGSSWDGHGMKNEQYHLGEPVFYYEVESPDFSNVMEKDFIDLWGF